MQLMLESKGFRIPDDGSFVNFPIWEEEKNEKQVIF